MSPRSSNSDSSASSKIWFFASFQRWSGGTCGDPLLSLLSRLADPFESFATFVEQADEFALNLHQPQVAFNLQGTALVEAVVCECEGWAIEGWLRRR
jgi:hypothetical protein